MQFLRSLEGFNLQTPNSSPTYVRSISCPVRDLLDDEKLIESLKSQEIFSSLRILSTSCRTTSQKSFDESRKDDNDQFHFDNILSNPGNEFDNLDNFDNLNDIDDYFFNDDTNSESNEDIDFLPALTLNLDFSSLDNDDNDNDYDYNNYYNDLDFIPLLPITNTQIEETKEEYKYPLKIFNETNYKFLKNGQLGSGVSGIVSKALDITSCQMVAIKTTPFNSTNYKQILNEINQLSKIEHQSLVKMIDSGYNPQNGDIHLVLEYMNCGSLYDFIRHFHNDNQQLSEYFIQHIAYQITAGLNALHNYQIPSDSGRMEIHPLVHNDLKPENILINSLGEIKLSDFGLMQQFSNPNELCYEQKGTVKYFSPERLHNNGFNYKSDIFGLGLILYECINGLDVDEKNQENQNIFTSYKIDNSKYSQNCINFIQKCLESDPKKRADTEELLKHPFLLSTRINIDKNKNKNSNSNSELKLDIELNELKNFNEPDFELLHSIIDLLSDYFINRSFLDEDINKEDNKISDKQCLNNISKVTRISVPQIRSSIVKVVNLKTKL